jgi:hypothetical protein
VTRARRHLGLHLWRAHPTLLNGMSSVVLAHGACRLSILTAISIAGCSIDLRPVAALDIEISRADPQVVYALSVSNGLFKRTAGGWSWVGAPPVWDIIVDPSVPTTLYGQGGPGPPILKSTDGGYTWFGASQGLPDRSGGLLIDPMTPSTLYATSRGTIFKTIDGGSTWFPLATPVPLFNLLMDEATPTTLFALAQEQSVRDIYVTNDGGDHWSRLGSWVSSTSSAYYLINPSLLAVDPSAPGTFYAVDSWEPAVLLKVTDAGATTVVLGVQLDLGVVFEMNPRSSANIYVSDAEAEIYETTDSAATWHQVWHAGVKSLAIDPVTPSTIWAGAVDGIIRSTNAGVDWSYVE